ncbi:hypothetical protein EON65_11220 [archaeon]|nr:MAG: hypothetical protein EON65_11220 [archaeon]
MHTLFRERILEVFQQNYLIWIHGFHLMLLPTFLRRRLPHAKIGYYFHTPFPSSELWRTMARRYMSMLTVVRSGLFCHYPCHDIILTNIIITIIIRVIT